MSEDPEKEMFKRFLEKGSIDTTNEEEDDEEEEAWIDMPCYVFNLTLSTSKDDKRCRHCKLFLTVQCPHIDDMADDVDDMDPD